MSCHWDDICHWANQFKIQIKIQNTCGKQATKFKIKEIRELGIGFFYPYTPKPLHPYTLTPLIL